MRSFQLACVAVLTFLPAHLALAQDPANPGGGLQIAKASGKIEAMALNQIKLVAEDKKEYFAVVTDQTALQYKGTAEADFLMPGLMIRFTGEVNQSGIVQAPVASWKSSRCSRVVV